MRIILVDSSDVFRMGLRALLAETREFVIVGEAGEAATALGAVRSHAPDLVIAELELADASGLALAGSIRDLAPSTRVLLLSSTASEVTARQAAVAGASGYVLKSQSAKEILSAVREAAAGRSVAPPPIHEAARHGDADVPRAARAAVLERLSAREREIFDLIIWGQTNKQVAVKLGISVKTVETHRSHINGKLQVHSAAELVRLASLCGLLADGSQGAVGATSTARFSHDKPPGKTAVERSSLPRLVAKIG